MSQITLLIRRLDRNNLTVVAFVGKQASYTPNPPNLIQNIKQ